MRKEWKLVLFMMGLIASFSVLNDTFASGDKNRKQNPVFDENGTLVGVVVPLNCVQLVNLEDGQTGWFCEDSAEGED